jgi:Zn-dependent M28 family amino/carboxypeptidase
VLLTLAEQLCRRERLYSLEFVAFTNEEYLPPGHEEYVRRRREPFEQIAAALHFDGVGLCAGPNTVAGFHLTDDLQRVVEPGTFTIMTGPNSRDLQSVTLTVTP